VLYLAEVQKKTGFMGAAKAELKLLACQRADQSWNPVAKEEVIPVATEEANKLNDGALVLADLNPNRQVQRIQEAGRPLVSILQNLSRQLEKSKSQEEEIGQWKQSLTYQSQELNRRQLEMEARLEQLQHMEENFERLEGQRQEIDTARQETERRRTEIERNRRELEGAWEHLLGEQRRLEEQQTEFQPVTGLDQDQARQIQELLARLSSGVAPTAAVREQLNLCFEMVVAQQDILAQHWQQLKQQSDSAQEQQDEVDRQAQSLPSRSECEQAQNSLEQLLEELKLQKSAVTSKQEHAQLLSLQLRNYEELYQQIYRVTQASSDVKISEKVDVEALEKMPLDQLEQLVQTYIKILQKVSNFVNDQEEELRFQHNTITEVQAKLQHAPEPERINLETELAEEQDRYQMLNETLVGQRHNLREREEILSQHQEVMWRRQGKAGNADKKIDLEPILVQIEGYRQQQSEERQKLERQIEQMRDRIQQVQGMIDHQADEQEFKRQELQAAEQNLLSCRAEVAQRWGRVNLYQEMLQPVQDSLDRLRYQLEALAGALTQVQETGDDQLQTIALMQQFLLPLCT